MQQQEEHVGKEEGGREASAERGQGKTGREIGTKAGKMKSGDTEVCHLTGRTGTVELLMGFLNSSVNNGLTDRSTYTQTSTHTCTCSTSKPTVGGTIIHTFPEGIHVVRPDVQVSKLCSLSGR